MKLETTKRQIAATKTARKTKAALTISFVLCALLLGSSSVKAQTKSDFQIWTAGFVTAQLRPETRSPTLWFDTHARRSGEGTLLILRPGVGYMFAPWGSVWVGYDWQPFFSDVSGERVDTQGVWEQLIFSHDTPHLALQSRTRFEQFWSDAGSGMSPRLREFVRANYRPSSSVPVGIAFWDEVFFRMKTTEWGQAGFFENRVFAGLALFANKVLRVEPGYMFVNATKGSDKLLSHVLAVNLFVALKRK